MKKIIVTLVAVISCMVTRADEGMWIPMLIGKNYETMREMGLKLSKEDLYSINQSSLKDAIVQFGGGCTGEIISTNGLLLTNHHCGYGSIAGLSTVENNYLDDGFWARSFKEELPVPGLSVIFLERVEDITAEVEKATRGTKGKEYREKFNAISKKIEKTASQNGKYVVQVKEYFNGNQVLMLVYKKYTDVRLVGTPPRSLGKFGGDTDNWIWPRHTADFSLFRVYAGPDNEPAEYSPSNQAYRPKQFLPISIKGIEEGDFAMIYGYPGRTNRYEISQGVDIAIKETNPAIVELREKRLEIMDKYMNQDKAVYLQYTSLKQRISNYWKYYIGQTEQLKRLDVVNRKKREEKAFQHWASTKAPKYTTVLTEYRDAYDLYKPYAKHSTYYSEGFYAPVLNRLAASFEPLKKSLSKGITDKDSIEKHVKNIRNARKNLMKDFHANMDQDIFAAVTEMFYQNIDASQHPTVYRDVILAKYQNKSSENIFTQYARDVYSRTFLTDSAKLEAVLKNPTLEQLQSDPAIVHALSFVENYTQNYKPIIDSFRTLKDELSKRYVKGLMEMKKHKLMYPDANSTMRITYGQILGYEPRDGVYYNYYTTIDGLMEKYKPGDDEFDLPKEIIQLYNKQDFGRYANKDGNLTTCFITNNDITGGNSGSPVLNAKGELIGLAFDGNWEAMSGDISFDKTYKRTIAVDARFILFIIDKMGKAHNLIREMDIREK